MFRLKKEIIYKAITYRVFADSSAIILTICFGLHPIKSVCLAIAIAVIHTIWFYINEQLWKKYWAGKFKRENKNVR